jgi:hypothetical protein
VDRRKHTEKEKRKGEESVIDMHRNTEEKGHVFIVPENVTTDVVIHKFREQTNTYPVRTQQKQPRDKPQKNKKILRDNKQKRILSGASCELTCKHKTKKHKKTTKKFT